MRKYSLLIITAILLISVLNGGLYAGWELDFEAGPVYNTYNKVRIPKQGGTEISLVDDLSVDSKMFFRGRLNYTFGERHNLTLFAAPLSLNASGQVNSEVIFENTTFAPDTPLEAVYRFDSYRLTYRYDILRRDNLNLGIGFTAKIRDASISLESADQFVEKTNTGFVPLINFKFDWSFADRFGLLFEGDALAAPQGRAEDVLLAMRFAVNENMAFKAGYRFLEGGADVDEVYNFALLNYIVAGVLISF